jgi:hypothetical protein
MVSSEVGTCIVLTISAVHLRFGGGVMRVEKGYRRHVCHVLTLGGRVGLLSAFQLSLLYCQELHNASPQLKETQYGYKLSTPDASPALADPCTRSQSGRLNVEAHIVDRLLDALILGYTAFRCWSESRIAT